MESCSSLVHKIVHIFKQSPESGIISILVNGGQLFLWHQPLSLFVEFCNGMFMYTTQQKAFTHQVMYLTIASNKREYAVTANCASLYPSGMKYWTTSFGFFPELLLYHLT